MLLPPATLLVVTLHFALNYAGAENRNGSRGNRNDRMRGGPNIVVFVASIKVIACFFHRLKIAG